MFTPGAPAQRAPRVRSALLPAALAALAAAGCSAEARPAAQVVRDAAAATFAAGTARVSVAVTVDTARGLASFTGEGTVDFVADQGRLVMDLHAFGMETVDLSIDGQTVYLRWPPRAGASRAWLRVDLGSLGADTPAELAALSQIGHANPARALDLLGWTGGARRVGGERLRGVSTTRYHAVVAPEAVPDGAGLAGALGAGSVPAGVWVDGDGRIRKMTLSVDRRPELPALAVTFETYDFGVVHQAAFPEEADVADLTELLRPSRPGRS